MVFQGGWWELLRNKNQPEENNRRNPRVTDEGEISKRGETLYKLWRTQAWSERRRRGAIGRESTVY